MRKSLLKYWIVIPSFLALVFAPKMTTLAEEAPKLSEYSIGIEDNHIVEYFETSDEEFLPDASGSSATLGGKEIEIVEIARSEEKNVPKVIDIIIDISGSMDDSRMAAAISTSQKFIDNMGENDMMRITRMGNDRYSTDFTSDKGELQAFLEETAVTKEDTNFYKVLKDEVEELAGKKDIPDRRMIVIFSDGAEDQATGITSEEAMNAVKESRIPIYAVALLKENPTDKQIESAKIMGSFARESFAGKYVAPVLEDVANDEVYPLLANKIASQFYVEMDPWEILVGLDDFKLELKLSDGESEVEYTTDVSQELLKELFYDTSDSSSNEESVTSATTESEKASDVVAAEETESSEVPAESNKTSSLPGMIKGILSNKYVLVIIIVVVVLLVLFIVGLIILLGRKNAKQEAVGDDFVEVTLFRQKTGEAVVSMNLYTELSIGRGGMCDVQINDNALSDKHCLLVRRGQGISFFDNNSTNGSYVNGIPVLGEKVLQNGDILLLGSDEYVINWR